MYEAYIIAGSVGTVALIGMVGGYLCMERFYYRKKRDGNSKTIEIPTVPAPSNV